jgi:A/G-specific adenine glycosylase
MMEKNGQTRLETTGSYPAFAATDDGIGRFRQMVLDHYRDHGRQMPWRETADPYRILVSEIMLQQTRVERVMVKYPEFVAVFSDFAALAKAPLMEILSAWQGMGYNRRAIALQKCAIRVVEEFGGTLPDDPAVLANFPGIGKATAASICAFAFDRPVVFIETNIRRVFIHFFFSDNAIVGDDEILPLVSRALPANNSRIWYWALMDLGTALTRTAANPNRRSRHYAKQSPFEGSDRKIRGTILRQLLPGKIQSLEQIHAVFPEDPGRIDRILAGLEADGFLVRDGNRIRLAS